MPPDHLLPDRLAAVLAVVYLIFNEGYGGRGDLAGEALRLGRALAELMPDEPEVHGLLAMMLLHDSRREARFRDGELVLLADQDRSLWDTRADRRGAGGARPGAGAAAAAGPYVRAGGDRVAARRRAARLARRSPRSTASSPASPDSPVVELNRAVAVAEAEGPEAGLEHRRSARRSTTTATCTPRAPSCCAGSVAPTRRATPTAARWRSSTTTPSGACSSGGWRSCRTASGRS